MLDLPQGKGKESCAEIHLYKKSEISKRYDSVRDSAEWKKKLLYYNLKYRLIILGKGIELS